MKKQYTYKPSGVCASEISFELADGIIHNIHFTGGCAGNTTGVARLAEGMKAQEVIARTKGINCHGGHSCPDELAKAIEACLAEALDHE